MDFQTALDQAVRRLDELAARVHTLENGFRDIREMLIKGKNDRALMIALLGGQFLISAANFVRLFFFGG